MVIKRFYFDCLGVEHAIYEHQDSSSLQNLKEKKEEALSLSFIPFDANAVFGMRYKKLKAYLELSGKKAKA